MYCDNSCAKLLVCGDEGTFEVELITIASEELGALRRDGRNGGRGLAGQQAESDEGQHGGGGDAVRSMVSNGVLRVVYSGGGGGLLVAR